jgi:hypothetical protein
MQSVSPGPISVSVPSTVPGQHALERVRDRGFADLDFAHTSACSSTPAPKARARPSWPRGSGSPSRPSTICSASSSASAIRILREAVAEIETARAPQLGSERFPEVRALLLGLNELTEPGQARVSSTSS